jgi:hypothetical protein
MTILRIQIAYQRFPELNLSFVRMLVRACPKSLEMIGLKSSNSGAEIKCAAQRCHGFAASKFLRDAIEICAPYVEK